MLRMPAVKVYIVPGTTGIRAGINRSSMMNQGTLAMNERPDLLELHWLLLTSEGRHRLGTCRNRPHQPRCAPTGIETLRPGRSQYMQPIV